MSNSTTCYLNNLTDSAYATPSAPEVTQGALSWEPTTYELLNIAIGPRQESVPIVSFNRDIGIRDGKTYAMTTTILDREGSVICTLTERLTGTLNSSDIVLQIQSGDRRSSTGWQRGDASLSFTSNGRSYGVTARWTSHSWSLFDDLHYMLTVNG